MWQVKVSKKYNRSALEGIDKCEDYQQGMSHQNDRNLDGFKDNDADTSHQNNDRIDKYKVNDDKLNE